LPAYHRDYRGIEGRQFQFDFAWPHERVAVEVMGGIWTGGRHTRGEGYGRDCEKLNLAQAEGWIVFYLTEPMMRDEHRRWFEIIAGVLRSRMGVSDADGS
jgi:hypothetical protein